MPNWKKVIDSGSDATLNSLYVVNSVTSSIFSGSFTGSLEGTSSWALNAITSSHAVNALSASYAITASYALNGGGGGGAVYSFHQTASAVTWSVTHSLNTYTPIIQVYDEAYNQLIPASVSGSSVNTVQLTFATATAGYAVLSTGGNVNINISGSNATLIQSTPATTWSFYHGLNETYPVFTIFDSNDDVIVPLKIHADNANTASIYFSTARTGTAVAANCGLSGSTFESASWAAYAVSASYAQTTATSSYVLNAVSASYATFAQTSATASYVLNAVSASYAQTTSYANNFTVAGTLTAQTIVVQVITSSTELVTGSLTVSGSLNALGGVTGSLFGTASWADNAITASHAVSALSSSYAISASYATSALSASYALSGSYAISASYAISSSHANHATSASYALSSSYATTASFADRTIQTDIYVKNTTGAQINKGTVVRIIGATGDNPLIGTASYTNDNNSANTLGITTANIPNDSFGYIITEGVLTGIDTSTPGWTAGQLLYLGANGSITGSAPQAPLHAVRLGEVLRVQLNNGSMYVRIDNGYELGELHDVVDTTTTASFGDLLVRSGSVWTNSKQLTGSYGLTGSLNISGSTTITGSIITTKGEYIKGYDAYTLTGYSLTPTSFNVGSLYANDITTFDGTSALGVNTYRSQPQYTLTGTSTSALTVQPFLAYPVVNLTGANARIDAIGFTAYIWRTDPADISTNGSNRLRGAYVIVGNRGGNGLTSAPYTNTVIGYEGSIENGGGTVNNMFGLRNYFWHGEFAANSTTNNNYGIYQGMTIGAASGGTHVVTNYYAFYQDTPSVLATGTLTNRWGLYFTDPNMPSYHAGKFGIGKTAPSYDLDVSGSGNFTNGLTVTGSLVATSFTGSLFGTASNAVSSSYSLSGSYAVTASYANTATSASYAVTASYLNPVTTGYVILTQVSASLNYADDAAAAAGGVPLGGLYRNGNFIAIRIV